MGSKGRDPSDLADRIERMLGQGLDALGALRGQGARGDSRSLDRLHRTAVQDYRKSMSRYQRRQRRHRRGVVGGAIIASACAVLGLLEVAGLWSPDLGSPIGWFAGALAGCAVSIASWRRLRDAGPPPSPPLTFAPPTPLPRGAIGQAEVDHFVQVRTQLIEVANSVERLHPDAGIELRRADIEAAGPLTLLADRLAVLHRIAQDLPASPAATAARESSEAVRARLADGCAMYEALLAASARLLAAPDTARSTAQVLGPALDAMISYAHGLQRSAETFDPLA